MSKYNAFLLEIYPVVPQSPDVPVSSYRIVSADDEPGPVLMKFLETHPVGPEFTVSCKQEEPENAS